MGPYLVGMRVHAKLAEKSTNFQYRVVGQWSVDGIHWRDFESEATVAYRAAPRRRAPPETRRVRPGERR